MNSFLNHLRRTNPSMYGRLSGHRPGTSGFNSAWKSLASQDPNGFNAVQHSFIKASHFDPAANKIKSKMGIDVTRLSPAVQNVLWSTSVQHGSQGALNVFRGAGIRPGMSDAEIIRRVYAERSAGNGSKYFSRSSSSIRKSVVSRFQREMQDALNMLA